MCLLVGVLDPNFFLAYEVVVSWLCYWDKVISTSQVELAWCDVQLLSDGVLEIGNHWGWFVDLDLNFLDSLNHHHSRLAWRVWNGNLVRLCRLHF